jgi:hypothetical protein
LRFCSAFFEDRLFVESCSDGLVVVGDLGEVAEPICGGILDGFGGLGCFGLVFGLELDGCALLCAGEFEAGLGLADLLVSFFSAVVALEIAFALPSPFCAFFPFSDTGVPPDTIPDTP